MWVVADSAYIERCHSANFRECSEGVEIHRFSDRAFTKDDETRSLVGVRPTAAQRFRTWSSWRQSGASSIQAQSFADDVLVDDGDTAKTALQITAFEIRGPAHAITSEVRERRQVRAAV